MKPNIILIKSENENEVKYEAKLDTLVRVTYSKESYLMSKMRYDIDIDKQITKTVIDEVISKLKELLDLKDVENFLQEIIIDYSMYKIRPDIVKKADELLHKYRNNKIKILINFIKKENKNESIK